MDKVMALEGRWMMGRAAPRELLDGIDTDALPQRLGGRPETG